MWQKIHFYRLLSSWLNWGANSQPLSHRQQRRKTVVIAYAKEVNVWSRCTFYHRRLRFEFPGRWNGWDVCKSTTDTAKTTTIEWPKGAVFTTATHSKRQQGRQDSWDIGVENKDEMIRVSRNGWRLVAIEETSVKVRCGLNLVFGIHNTRSQFELFYYTTGSS